MSNDFFIKISEESEALCYNFGVFSSKVQTPNTFVCSKHDKPYSRFFYVVNGLIIFNKGSKKELQAPAGSLVYLPNDITYKSEWPAGVPGEYITINFQISDRFLHLPDRICIATVDKNEYYLKMFKNAYKIWMQGSLGYKLEVLSELYKILYSLDNDILRKQTKQKHQLIYKGIIFLENNYLHDVTVCELAKICNTSEGNFRRLFKKYKNMSPITYRNYLRIKKACDLLNSGEYSISEVAEAVNIPDVCYFYKLFSKFMNTTPKSFIS